MNGGKTIARGGRPGFGRATVGIDPNTFEVLNGHPNKIPTDKILGGVVQNCQKSFQSITDKPCDLKFNTFIQKYWNISYNLHH